MDSNCERINKADKILNIKSYQNNQLMTKQMNLMNQNVNKHFKNILYQQIKNLFQLKANIVQINQKLQTNQSLFNAFNNTHNLSYGSLNNRSFLHQQDRQSSFKQINTRIQDLNLVMKRMNVLVSGQGQLVDQIDQNMKKGIHNMKSGRELLQQRVKIQEGTDQFQFSFQGKVNKVIMAMYGINIVLILVWVLKNFV